MSYEESLAHLREQRAEARRRMDSDLPLFDAPVPYAKGSDTSREAAPSSLDAAKLRRAVLAEYRQVGQCGMTPDQCAARLHLSVLTVRPRCTELTQSGFLRDTGRRDRNRSGKRARILRATTKEERR